MNKTTMSWQSYVIVAMISTAVQTMMGMSSSTLSKPDPYFHKYVHPGTQQNQAQQKSVAGTPPVPAAQTKVQPTMMQHILDQKPWLWAATFAGIALARRKPDAVTMWVKRWKPKG